MAKERTIIKPINNVLYVEPNYLNSLNMIGSNGVETYEVTPDLEDYSIFVNLEVELVGRTINALNKTLVLSYTSYGDKETINLMQGSKIPIGEGHTINSLTTNYTNIHIKDMQRERTSPELFGISYIDIAYRNYTVPEVTIEFVDVRGAAVFGQREVAESQSAEKAINENYAEDIQNTFFQCFFTFPYPKFRLLVKGFYGEPVSYELTCADFRARFNSDTGNFSCTAKFVGYMFSFLNDVMMNGLIAAPYSDFIGAEYWKQQNFTIKGYDGGQVETPKLAQLLEDLPQAINNAEHIANSSKEVQEKTFIEEIKGNIEDIASAYREYCRYIVEYTKPHIAYDDLNIFISDIKNSVISNGAIILVKSNGLGRATSDKGKDIGNNFSAFFEDKANQISSRIETVYELVKKFNESYPERQLPYPTNVLDTGFTTDQLIYPKENDSTKFTIDKLNREQKIKDCSISLYNVFKENVERENNKSGENVSRYSDYQWGFFYDDNKFYDTLNAIKEQYINREKEINKILEGFKKDSLAQKLKFYPTVENMTRIIMAHFETFAYMIFKTGLMIQSEEPKRTLSTLGIADSNDISDVPGLSDREKEIPPFPKFTKIVEKNGLSNREEAWVGIYGSKFKEVDLVHGILNGVRIVADLKNKGEDNGGFGSETSVRSVMKIPLSPLDMIATKSPYGNFSQNEPADLLGLVGLRAIQVISSPNFNGWDEKCEVLGEAEAVNLLNREKISNDLKEKIISKTESTIVDMLKGSDSNELKPTTGVWPWNYSTSNQGVISNNGDLNICKVKTIDNKTIFTVPYQDLNWEKIKNDEFTNKSSYSDDYFDVCENGYGNNSKDNIFTIETNLNRFKRMAETQMVGINGIDHYAKKIISEATYASSSYTVNIIVNKANTLIASPIEGAANLMPSDESCMLPCTFSYFPNMKLFGGGYEMDKFHQEKPGEGGEGWYTASGEEVKRRSANGYKEFLESHDTSKYTITEFPGVNEYLEPCDLQVTLFGQKIYYMETNREVKAFMFLSSLGRMYNYFETISGHIAKKERTISIVPLASILYSGAVLWAYKHQNEFKYTKPFGSSTSYHKRCYDALSPLSDNVKNKLISTFTYFVTNGLKNNSLIKPFTTIKEPLELKLTRKDITYEQFFDGLGEPQDKKWYGSAETWFKEGVFKDRGYTDLLSFIKGELGENFVRSYITIDEDLKGDKKNLTLGMRLGNRDGSIGVTDAVNVALMPCIFMKDTKFFFSDSPAKINIDEGKLVNFLQGFLKRLREGENTVTADTSVAQAMKNEISDEVKIGIYRYCKLLYDKWIGGTKEGEFNEMWTVHALFDASDKYFHFIDSFYNKIGQYILINIGHFCETVSSCYTSEQFSLLSFLSTIYAKNKFNLLCVQNFMDMQNLDNMKKMFDCVPYTSGWNYRNHPNFIVQYPYEPSSHLDYGDAYENDGFMINEPQSTTNRWPEALKSRLVDSDNDYNIPAFGVTYGKMYQSYFKDIDVSMDNPKVTEQSIKAQFAIACLNNPSGNTNDRSNGYTIGQDLFSIYSNNSYTCNVTMMGCAWVQPMMYFVLNNVPMFRGTYMVISVSHRIEQGEMITKFTGVRMANVNTRIAQECCVRGSNDQAEATDNTNINQESIYERIANTDNDCPYKRFPIVNTSGGYFGEPNYSSLLTGLVKDAKGNKLESPWANRVLLDTLTAMAIAESDGSDIGISSMAAIIYNRVRSRDGSFINVLNTAQFSSLKDGNAGRNYNNHSSKWDYAQGIVSSMFSNGACSILVGTKYVTPNWDLDRNKNNDLYYLKPNTEYTLTQQQVSNFYLNAFKEEWYNEYNSKDNYIRHSDCKLLAVLGKQAICMEPTYAKKLTINEPAQIIGNEDKHISDLCTGFINALNQTSKASAVNVNIGVDNDKSHDNILYLQSPDSNFGKVFDIIINAYSDTVSEITWVIPGNGKQDQSLPPKYLIVTLEPKNNSTKIVVISEDGTKVESIAIEKDGGMNKDFCKALVKKYRNNNDLINKDLTPKLSDTPEETSDIKKLFDTYDEQVKDCQKYTDEITGKSGGSSGGGDGTVKNPSSTIKTKDWNVDVFINNLHYWQREVCNKHPDRNLAEAKKRSRGGKGGCGRCTGVINRALQDTGCGDKFFRTYPWEVYRTMNGSAEFGTPVMQGSGKPSNVHFDFPSPPQKGDICLMWCNYIPDTKKNHFHSCAFDGSNWVSDFVQNNCNVYTGKDVTVYDNIQWYVFRHK